MKTKYIIALLIVVYALVIAHEARATPIKSASDCVVVKEADEPPSPKPKPKSNQLYLDLIKKFALKYGANEGQMIQTIKGESSFNPSAYNGKDSHASSTGSHGMCQFARETINGYAKKIGLMKPDPYNPSHCIEVMAYMFSIGEAKQWTVWRELYKKAP